MSGSAILLVLAVFAACAVEAVEALTIVLAVGLTRDWRSALLGVGAGLVVLAALIALLGPALVLLPLRALRLVVGGLLLIFGLQWLRKAILRASGYKALRDEEAAFAREEAAARATAPGRAALDAYALTVSFKAVLLEGLEVVFIVLTLGANQGRLGLAGLAGVAAVVAVTLAGVALRAPLARVPENALKFGVGVMLSAFGIFWGGEGAGVSWPGGEAALPVLVALVLATALALTALLRRRVGPRSRVAALGQA